jgi:DNA-binding CsgD family transcriptional regulator
VYRQSHTAIGLEAEEGDLELRGRWSCVADRLMPLVRRRAGKVLSRRQREVIARRLMGQTQSEIGRGLGVSKVTVFHILRRAYTRFREEFTNRGITLETLRRERQMADAKNCRGWKGDPCEREADGPDGLCRTCRGLTTRYGEGEKLKARLDELEATVAFLDAERLAAQRVAQAAERERDEAAKQAAEAKTRSAHVERRLQWVLTGLAQNLISVDMLQIIVAQSTNGEREVS